MDKRAKLALGAAAVLGIGYLVFSGPGDTSGVATDPTGNGGIGDADTGVGSFDPTRVAQTLYDSMRYTGTDESRILAALTHVTQSQFAQVIQAFGYKSYNRTFGNQINYTPWTPLELVDLPGWLQEELSDTDYAVLAAKYPLYL